MRSRNPSPLDGSLSDVFGNVAKFLAQNLDVEARSEKACQSLLLAMAIASVIFVFAGIRPSSCTSHQCSCTSAEYQTALDNRCDGAVLFSHGLEFLIGLLHCHRLLQCMFQVHCLGLEKADMARWKGTVSTKLISHQSMIRYWDCNPGEVESPGNFQVAVAMRNSH